MSKATTKGKGLRERLRDGEDIICAEGYMWELERRGYLPCGAFTPEVVVDYPERVINLHEEFVHAGSDVVEAFTYYGGREKLKLIGREDDLEKINLNSLKMARDVADKHGLLMAGNLCNTTTFTPDNEENADKTAAMFKEQVQWAVSGNADYMIGETFADFQEAKIALETIQKYGEGMPAVITIVPYSFDTTCDDVPYEEALSRLEELGADVVGLNCGRGPSTMVPLLKKVKKICKGPIAALPVPFRTNETEVTFQSLRDPNTGAKLYPTNLDCRLCCRSDIAQFAKTAKQLGIRYIGLCCGANSSLLREVSEAYGRNPPASKYAPKSNLNFAFGENVLEHNKKVYTYMVGNTKFN